MSSSAGTSALSAVPTTPVTHAHYRREPYVRCTTRGGGTVDGKAVAWTRTQVLLHWIDDDGVAHNRWVPAPAVQRIPRDDSAWRDPYDDFRFYYSPSPAAA
ncbi:MULTISPECIES: hypothetical protein [unclassified Arthrobacter]|uniref:hypothetical protein n=1 Tax=unclassified Arthrobacter TaxID=235627 RepID=UPI001D137D58|nr:MULTISPECIES: hypothetical protein [unclassified Arthrobacter]MCC3275273.1 hypothetical protein [Arthrobacter sp. zg-Y20]MCC3278348.1 hypothetical protein [Arthrobacter sp. zg-Y40]MCC9176719.1 hypothetical protein [Arthrobacter sp. zg-Y750]MDK1315430.1 hypothetical protein [Arthrobacter sp. zg.Y20]MDK1326577.1 hypothetical protein [Arthrobacter sp. zg-Y1143]